MTDLLLAALFAAFPLPLTHLVPWWTVWLYAIPLLWQVWRVRGGCPPVTLRAAGMNAFSLACLGLFLIDMIFLSRRLIHVAVHLTLSLIALKAFHLQTRRDQAQFALLTFFLAVAGAANSTHPLLAPLLLMLTFLFTSWLLQAMNQPVASARRTAAALTGACLILAAPLFLLLPRLRDPYVPGAQSRLGESASYSLDSLGLGSAVPDRDDERVALRVRYEGPAPNGESLRLRARVFQDFRGRDWSHGAVRYRMVRFRRDGTAWLGPREGKPMAAYEIFPKDLSPQYLPLPYAAAGLEARLAYVHAGNDGTMRISAWTSRRHIHYRVFTDPAGAPAQDPPGEAHLGLPPATERELRELAMSIFPEEMDIRQYPAALVEYFSAQFQYARDDYQGVEDPLREFLWVRKRGHCEYFATAGALLLRARGLPARVVVGFLGGERNPLQDYYVVRFRNAHAWVEAWIDGQWTVVDPTPPQHRPALIQKTLSDQTQFLWETLSFFWDRHIIGFAFGDQAELLKRALDAAGPLGVAVRWMIGPLMVAWIIFRWTRRLRLESRLLRRYRALRKWAARRSGARVDTLTPGAVERIVIDDAPDRKEDIDIFFRAYREASFGPPGGKHPGQAAEAAFHRLKHALKVRERKSVHRPRSPFQSTL